MKPKAVISFSLFIVLVVTISALLFNLVSLPAYAQTQDAWNLHRQGAGNDLNFYYSLNGTSALQLQTNGHAKARRIYDLDDNTNTYVLNPNETTVLNALTSNSLTLTPVNPTLASGGSYITVPYGLYVSGGTFYAQNQIQARGGVNNDSGTLSLTASNSTISAPGTLSTTTLGATTVNATTVNANTHNVGGTLLGVENAFYMRQTGSHPSYTGTRFYLGNGTSSGYVYGDSSGFGLLTAAGAWSLNVPPGTANVNFYGNLYSPGNANFSGGIHSGSNLLNWPGYGSGLTQNVGAYVYPGGISGMGGYQQSFYLASHASWGLYTNTGFFAAGSSSFPFIYDSQNSGYYVDPNGTSYVNLFTANDIRPDIIYDRNNTGYYADLNSHTYLYSLQAAYTLQSSQGLHSGATLLNWPGYNGVSQAGGHYIWPGSMAGNSWQQSYYLASSPSYGLYTNTSMMIASSLGVNGYGPGGCGGYAICIVGSTYVSGGYGSSDIRVKHDITPINNALDTILKLKGVTFRYNDTQKAVPTMNGKHFGYIAQEVESIIPEAVTADDAGDLKGLDYGSLTALITEGMKELYKQLTDLKDSLSSLKQDVEERFTKNETEVEALKEEVQELRNEIQQLKQAQPAN